MKIKNISYNNINIINYKHQKPSRNELNKSFEKKYVAGMASIALFGIALGGMAYMRNKNSFRNQLALDLSKELNQKISPKQLKSVISNKELLKLLSTLKEENYVASAENLKNGTFLADLHSHSRYSDGTITIQNLLDQAAVYGDKLNKINGKKFTIALSDHDGVEGVKEALKIIVKNPDKYKNINFVPASEISFIMPNAKNSQRSKKFKSDVEMPEILVFGINPFSKETKQFFDKIYSKRLEQIKISIEEAKKILPNVNFNFKEYTNLFNPQEKYCFANQHWKIWNYLHTKARVSEIANEQKINADYLYNEIYKSLGKNINPYSLNEYIKNKNIITETENLSSEISKYLKEKIFPIKIGENEARSSYEITFKDIVNYAKKGNTILGFAHPGFTMQNIESSKILSRMNLFIKESDGKLKLVEKYHQAYPIGFDIQKTELDEYNKIIDKLDLIKMGGRDNHKPSLF